MDGRFSEDELQRSFCDFDDFPLNGSSRKPNAKLPSNTRLPRPHGRAASSKSRNRKARLTRHREPEKASGCPDAKSEVDARRLNAKRRARAASRIRTACRYSKSQERSPWYPWYNEHDYYFDNYFDNVTYPDDEDWDDGWESEIDEGHTIVHEACLARRPLDFIRVSIAEDPDSLLTQDRFGRTPLHCACESSRGDWWRPMRTVNFPVVNELLTACPKAVMTEDKDGRSPLHYLCGVWHLREGPSRHPSHLRPVLQASKAVFSVCPEAGVLQDRWGDTPLHLLLGPWGTSRNSALSTVRPEQFHPLVDSFNIPREKVHSDLCLSMLRSNLEAAKIQNGKGITPLHIAVEGLCVSLVLDVLRLCPEAAAIKSSNSHHSPLLLVLRKNASSEGHAAVVSEIVAALVRAAPEVAYNLMKEDPKWCAKLLENPMCRQTLSDLCKDDAFALDQRGMTLLHRACSSHPSANVIEHLLDQCPEGTTEKADFQGNTPLHHAFLSGASVAVKRKLTERGEGALGTANAAGMTPLQLGSVEEAFVLFRLLPRLCNATQFANFS